jgi:hypothetical protein
MNFDASRDSLIALYREEIARRLEDVRRQIEAEYQEVLRQAMALAFNDVFAANGAEPPVAEPLAEASASDAPVTPAA